MRGRIACGHPLTAEAGAQMLRQGGNAIDAAVAASFASYVCESTLTGLWGGGFALVHSATAGRPFLFDFFVNMPGLGLKKIPPKNLDFKSIFADFRGAKQEFHIGKGSVGVPGNILGLATLHKKLGALPFREVLEPAIRYAREGVVITKMQAFVLTILEAIYTHSKEGKKIFAPRGKLLREGDRLLIPDLADRLELLGFEGPEIFYQGEVGEKLVTFLREGGLLTLRDLKDYRVMIRKPLRVDYRGETILMNPSPSAGGPLIAHSLKFLKNHSLKNVSFESLEFLKLLISVMQKTNLRRSGLLGNTTHISVTDEMGNAVSLTTSHGSGAGIVVPGLGLPFNNILGEQDLNPRGFFKIKSGERFQSMMCPTLTLKQGKPHIVLGSGGSNRLRSAILQTLIRLIDFGDSLKEAVESPRIHWEAGELNVEPGFAKKIIRGLLKKEPRITFWRTKNLFFGGVHALMDDEAIGDSRRGGVALKITR